MIDKKKRKIFSATVALLLLLSVFSAVSSTLVAQGEDDVEGIKGDVEVNRDIYELRRIVDENIDRTFPIDRLDVLDPELTQLLSGSSFYQEGITTSNELLTDPHTIDQHNVQPVHDMGIKGDNVVVSLMDTGFDMAHPDLIGTHAVFEYIEGDMDPEMEMYDGYPIAFDPVSLIDYAYDGEVSQDYHVWEDVAPDLTDNSWYVNTSYEATAFEHEDVVWANFTLKQENWTYEMPEGVEDGDLVRFGFHPDDKLLSWYGERPAVLVTQDDTDQWNYVYVDLTNDRSFVEEKAAYIDGDDPVSEVLTRDITGDGIADISGGMVYFVAREHEGEPMPIPYAEHMRETINTLMDLYFGYPPGFIEANYEMDPWEAFVGPDFYTTPEPGDVVALMGDFNDFGAYGAHGTWTASAVVGQAVTGVPDEDMVTGEPSPFPPNPEGGTGLTTGLAPNATIIPMGRFFDYLPEEHPLSIAQTYIPVGYSSIFFTTEGYTGDVTITSDSADIASSSFGRTIDENHGGFNFFERLFDYVGTQHTQSTLFINSQGNEGSGFGTVSAPSGAQGVLSVGASGNQLYRVDGWNMFDGGPNPWYGEVTSMTSTGPHAKGSHGPDIMTNGQFGYGADPINQQVNNIGHFQGNNSWTLWSGTSLSAPNAAGIAALVYQAYVEAHGEAPDAATLKNIIMQGANDINNTPNLQGPGDANALHSVLIAQGHGLYSEEFQWRPGTNPEMGVHVEHHVNIMEPGESLTDTLTLHNWNPTGEVDYSMSVLRDELVGSTQVQLESGPSGRVPLIAINHTGVYELIYNETNENWDLSEDPIAELDHPDADLFRFGVHTPWENQGLYDLSLAEFYHWTDVDGDGAFDGFSERTRIGHTWANMRAYNTFYGDEVCTSDYFTIHDALERAEDGIIVQMNNDLFGFGDQWVTSFEFTLNIEQYNQEEWEWIEFEGSTSGTIPADDHLTYELTANVPGEAPKGIYSGKLMIEDTTNDRILPVPITITVGEYTDLSEPIHFAAGDGDAEEDFGIYRNDRLYGSWAGGLTGDWRFYTFHLTEDILDQDVILELTFDDERSDMSAFLLGGANHDMIGLGEPVDVDPFSMMMPARYGVNTLETHYSTDIDRGNYVAHVTDEPMEEGTYMIAVQSHRISGHEPYQEFSGRLFASNVRTLRDEARVVDRGAINFPGELLAMPDGEPEVEAFFRYRQVGEDEWTESEGQTLTDAGEFDETVTGLEDGIYEWKPVISWNPENTGAIGSPVVLQDLSEMVVTYPAEGNIVQGDPLTIWAEMTEDFEGQIVDAEINLGDWFPYENVNIEDNFMWWDLPLVLSEGYHTYEFYLEDNFGNTHTETVTFEVDNTVPYIDIITPTNGVQEIAYEDEFTIEGNTNADILWINEEEVPIDEDGNFSYTATLVVGQNVFHVIAEDEAGNVAEIEVYALYLPDYEDIPLIWENINDLWNTFDDYLTEEEIHALLEDYVTHGDLEAALNDYLTEEEIHALLEDYVTTSHLAEALEDYLTEDEINALLDDYMTRSEIHALLDDYMTESEIRALLADYLTEDEIDDILEGYVTHSGLQNILADYLDEEEIDEVMDQLRSSMMDDIESMLDDYATQEELEDLEDDISAAENMALIGIILAVLALIIAIYAVAKKGKTTVVSEEEPFEEETFESDEDIFDEEDEDDIF